MKRYTFIILLLFVICLAGCSGQRVQEYEGNISLDVKEAEWYALEYDAGNPLHKGLILMNTYENHISTHFSAIPLMCQPAFGRFLVPAGAGYLEEMTELAIDKRLFEAELMSAIGLIGKIVVAEDELPEAVFPMAVDGSDVIHEIWISAFKEMMNKLASGEMDRIGSRMDTYGIFILPYVREHYDEDPDFYGEYISTRFFVESFASFTAAGSPKAFLRKNKKTIDGIENIINKYGNANN